MLTRSFNYYLNEIYIPASMIVVVSWIPFWLDRDDNHARVGLGVTTVLTMTTLVTNTNQAMPKISYLKSLDIYLEICFGMVFAALIQYAFVGYSTSCAGNKVSDLLTNCHKTNDPKACEVVTERIRFGGHNPCRIDWHSRWLFPTVFIAMNLIYWVTYLRLSRHTIDAIESRYHKVND